MYLPAKNYFSCALISIMKVRLKSLAKKSFEDYVNKIRYKNNIKQKCSIICQLCCGKIK